MTRCALSERVACSEGSGSRTWPHIGIGFGLSDMPALAAMVRVIVAEEQALRRPVTVVITPAEPGIEGVGTADEESATRGTRRAAYPLRRGARRGLTGTALITKTPPGSAGSSFV